MIVVVEFAFMQYDDDNWEIAKRAKRTFNMMIQHFVVYSQSILIFFITSPATISRKISLNN
jgi:hypothetical protein